MVGTNYLEFVEDLVHSRNRVKPAGAHSRTQRGLRRSVQYQEQFLIPDDGKAISARTDEHNTACIQYSKQHNPATEAITTFSGEHDPPGGHSPQGVELVNDKRR